MSYAFSTLTDEYTALFTSMVVTQPSETARAAHKLLGYKERYESVWRTTNVPIVLLAALHNRESDADFRTYLGNGEPLNRVTRLVPKGRGPFVGPHAWEAGANDALHIDRLDQVANWSWEKALYYGELWNGFGPRNHGIHTGYLWSGTTHYTRGKYVADGVWNGAHVDTQLGIVPVMREMVALDPGLNLPMESGGEARTMLPLPLASQIQHMLNLAGFGPLAEDGSIGFRTRTAIRAFQSAHSLVPDGIVGPKTTMALVQATSTKT